MRLPLQWYVPYLYMNKSKHNTLRMGRSSNCFCTAFFSLIMKITLVLPFGELLKDFAVN